ncbi:class I SAM-dependent methyltransferase [Actinomadura harenae]|uniref:Methyltransferase domain-containing protein n=1 Tax=Actinomadura harenae TaxID=2483351 RepID=A0A3M2LNW3_9ACTN|nr:class I SAM-dependent methyltransferase [Actinomadura harenae]RMI39119.1 methyltransferase domain-containing protein [Actinomadura harenae]
MPDALPESPEDLTARRAASFGANAAAYAAERPDYPIAAVRWVLDRLEGRPARVLDLGAGTGKLTGVLAAAGIPAEAITAVEPDPAMLDELRRAHPGVTALEGAAEEIPLPDGSVDAVLIGQAMHWFDLDRAYPEIHRVLAPGGVMGGLWNRDDSAVPWVAEMKRIARSGFPVARGRPRGLPEHPLFPNVEQTEFPHVQPRTAESMAATIGTHSHVLIMDGPERDVLLGRIVDHLRATPETAEGEFDLPLITLTLRAVAA